MIQLVRVWSKADNREMPIDESNWLDSKVIECGACGQKLHWLWHSPMYDDTFFYCTQCPKRVEVSYYDDTALRLRKIAQGETSESNPKEFTKQYFALIERHLAPCDCGGRFEYAAVRRCLKCSSPLAQSEPGRDVWPPETDSESFDAELESQVRSLVKTKNIWKPQAILPQ